MNRQNKPKTGTVSRLVAAAIIGAGICWAGMRLGDATATAVLDGYQTCAGQVLNSEVRVRDDVRMSEARIAAAVAKANAAAADKVGVLIRELGLLSQHQRGLDTAWRVETEPEAP